MNKIYEGSDNEIADLAITLHAFLGRWKSNHPNYNYSLDFKHNQLHLTIEKTTK